MDVQRTEDRSDEAQLNTADIASSGREPTAEQPAAREARAGGMQAQDDESAGTGEPLLPPDRSSDFVAQWERIQTRFVDEPRTAVEEADHLVAEVMQVLAEGFSQERTSLEGQWDRGNDVSTEDLRVALQRYRSFFQRLLAA
jgi:hypothetical protein